MTTFERLAQKNKIDIELCLKDLKQQLSDTDYKAIKYAEGWISDEEYAPIKTTRELIREQIRVIMEGMNDV